MFKTRLSKTISQTARNNQCTVKKVELKLGNILKMKYLNKTNLEMKLIENGKMKILRFLYTAQNQKISSGYNCWHGNYQSLLYQFVGFDAAEKVYFDRICQILFENGFIYTNQKSTEVGLTGKGVLFYAATIH